MKMTRDRTTKVLLAVIAALLMGIFLRPVFSSGPVMAQNGDKVIRVPGFVTTEPVRGQGAMRPSNVPAYALAANEDGLFVVSVQGRLSFWRVYGTRLEKKWEGNVNEPVR
jgi:hypothetical protein